MNELEIDAKTFLSRLPANQSRWCEIIQPNQLNLGKRKRACIFIYARPQNMRFVQRMKDGTVRVPDDDQEKETADYISVRYLRNLVQMNASSGHPFPILLIENESLLDARACLDARQLALVQPIIGRGMHHWGATAWLRDGRVFAQDELGTIHDTQCAKKLLEGRLQQMNSATIPSDPSPLLRKKEYIELMRAKRTAMKVPADPEKREPEQHNAMMDALHDLVLCDPRNLLIVDKETLFETALTELEQQSFRPQLRNRRN
jgi:hypothetical protein